MAIQRAAETAIPDLIEALSDPENRYWACRALGQLGPRAERAFPTLVELLDDPQPAVRQEAILALGAIGPAAAPTVPSLARRLDDPDARNAATIALGQIGPRGALAAKKIRENLSGDDEFLQMLSAWALARIFPKDKPTVELAISSQIAGLNHPQPSVRTAAARGLLQLGVDPEIIWFRLRDSFENKSVQETSQALAALARIGEPAVPLLVLGLRDKRLQVSAAFALGKIGSAAKEAVEPLMVVLQKGDPAAQQEAVLALAAIGRDAEAAFPRLVERYPLSAPIDRQALAYAFGQFGPAARPAIPLLLKDLAGRDPLLPTISACALVQIDPSDSKIVSKAVPVLKRGLQHPQPMVRFAAAEALGRIGPRAKDAIPALNRAVKDPEPPVREMAVAALHVVNRY